MALSQSIELIHLSRIGQGARTCILGRWLCMGCSLICITCIKSYYCVQTRMPWGLNANNQVHLHTQSVLNTYITTPYGCDTTLRGSQFETVYRSPESNTPSSYPSTPGGGGGHCLFEGRYPLPNYCPCFFGPVHPSVFFDRPLFLRVRADHLPKSHILNA